MLNSMPSVNKNEVQVMSDDWSFDWYAWKKARWYNKKRRRRTRKPRRPIPADFNPNMWRHLLRRRRART